MRAAAVSSAPAVGPQRKFDDAAAQGVSGLIKRWTMMVIPHDQGTTHSYAVTSVHVWSFTLVLLTLCFASGFLFQKNRLTRQASRQLEARHVALEDRARAAESIRASEETREMAEAALRSRFEARDAAITAELGRLYDLETELRLITGLPPRAAAPPPAATNAGGKGGGEPALEETPPYTDDALMRPPELIYGLSHPSADLIVQEIDLRAESLRQLLHAMDEQREQIAHTPSILPSPETERWISSRFGYRKDPFTRRVRHHDGLDFSTRYGTPVVATAKGVVSYSAYAQYLGHLVKVDHGRGIETWYGHLSKRLVEKGDPVERGQAIGKLGSSGRSTGPHIHYEVHVDGKPVDPAKYIGH